MRTRDTSPHLKVLPRNHETDVPRDATLLLTAPRPIDHLSANGLRVRSENRDVDGVLDLSSDGRILFWRPAETMGAQVEHQVTVSGMLDERGAPFDPLSSTFVTGIFCYVDLQLNLE